MQIMDILASSYQQDTVRVPELSGFRLARQVGNCLGPLLQREHK